ncbi:MAG: putative DNA modification/repair radical SAM protein [Vallitaleaceae bacterium]|nr:putative DNA modification/repair radical SAM protein [Vallitaleaceae bacterium]
MLTGDTLNKLTILADAAKYDVSCASSGVERKNSGGIGNSAACGICHTWAADGRCVSLLKILMTNDCVYDCAYCINRQSNDVARASFTPEEVASLTIEFYRRNYIEGLFLSSAVEHNPNSTMERIVKVLQLLRNQYHFSGYIHVKAIPGADSLLIREAGYLADRMSVNIELATEESLRLLAPQKPIQKLYLPMKEIKDQIITAREEKTYYHHAPNFVPAGQSTQMIVGATRDSDRSILFRSEKLYQDFQMKRVYYSAYMPVNTGSLLPSIQTEPPLLREHRLYQADWLMRFYKFKANEILTDKDLNLDLDFDPKMMWALRNMDQFPMEVNKVSYDQLIRIPGIGMQSAKRIIIQRRVQTVDYDGLKKMGVVLKRARFFLTCQGRYYGEKDMTPEFIKRQLSEKETFHQVSLFEVGQELRKHDIAI